MTLLDAIAKLDKDNPAHWTKSGAPSVRALSKLMGRRVSAAERNAAWRRYLDTPKLGNQPPAELQRRVDGSRYHASPQAVFEALRTAGLGQLQPYLLDSEFTALPMEVWQEVLDWSDVDRVQYVAQTRDCDNFAIALAGQIGLRLKVNGCGVVVDYSGRHAYSVLLVAAPDGSVSAALLEPQSDRIVMVGDKMSGHEAYAANQGWILFA